MKVLLIDPPFERLMGIKRNYFPLGLCYLASVLEKGGHNVAVLDAEKDEKAAFVSYGKAIKSYPKYLEALEQPDHLAWLETEEKINFFNPKLVAVTVVSPKLASAEKIADICKKNNPKTIVVFGGPHCTAVQESVLRGNKNIDFIAVGEGEQTLLELCNALENGQSVSGINGLCYRKGRKVLKNNPRALLKELDDFPFPARHLLLEKEKYDSEDLGLLVASRGCPFNCGYCASDATWQGKTRFRSAKNVLAEIKKTMAEFGTMQFSFEDDCFTARKDFVSEFCRLAMESKPRFNFSAITRLDLLNEEIIKKLKQAGCNHLRVGVESGSDSVLKKIGKNIAIKEILKKTRIIKKFGIYISAYFMVGLPEETEKDIEKTMDLMKKVGADYISLSIYTPFPKTRLFEELLQAGAIKEPIDWKRYAHGSAENYFSKKIGRERFRQLLALCAKAADKNNCKPAHLLNRIIARKSVYLKNPFLLLMEAKQFLFRGRKK